MPARVMIADDSLFMRTLLRRVLAPLDVEVIGEADNGDDAITGYADLKPDLLLLDITMPGTSGITAAKRILAEYPDACIIVCSALASSERAMATLKLGVRDLITKPFEAADIQQRIRHVLNGQIA
ncbi:MAG: response regulator [Candidatus Sericytochromatia bacterium]|nr:response regulator [Candidatus Sericytochromatia bacterium]